jgi:predicted permease
MSLFVTFSKMVVIMFAIAMGYLANKKGFFNEEVNKKMTKVVLNITLPAMILSTVMTGDGMPPVETTLSMLKVSLVFYGLEGVFTLFLPRVLGGTSKQKGVWRHSLMFPNLAFIGYPVIEALFGKSALFYATILCLPYNILTYSIGPAMLGGSSRFRVKDLCTPMMITAVISLGIALSGLQFPALVGDMFDFVGGITAPFSLLILGSVLAGTCLVFTVLSIRKTLAMVMPLDNIWMILGLAAAISLIAAGYFLWAGKRVPFLQYFVVCLYFALHMICRYREWSGNPQTEDYIFAIFACICLAMFSYHRAAFCTGLGQRRMLLFFGLMALFFCPSMLLGSNDTLFYLAGTIWAATNLCTIDPPQTKSKEE